MAFKTKDVRAIGSFARVGKDSIYTAKAGRLSKKPSKQDIDDFMVEAFGTLPTAKYYREEWYGRFDSPRHAWSMSDYDTRKVLSKRFPHKFGGLDKDENLNNPENQVAKYDKW